MESRIFGKTGKQVYVLGLGTYGHGAAYGGIGKKNSIAVMNEAIKKIPDDVFFLIDTAPRYGCGKVEEWIGEFINNSKMKNLLIATKGGRHIEPEMINAKDFSDTFLRQDLGNSLKRLKMNKIFLYQLHNPNLKVIKEGKVFHLLESFRDEDKVEWYGISIDNYEEGISAINYCEKNKLKGLTAIQVIYNPLQKRGLDTLFQLARKKEIAVIAREPLLRGFLTDKYSNYSLPDNLPPAPKKVIDMFGEQQILEKKRKLESVMERNNGSSLAQFSLQFSLSNPLVTLIIPGINRLHYSKQNFDSVHKKLTKEAIADIHAIPDIKKC